jgi:protein SCO1
MKPQNWALVVLVAFIVSLFVVGAINRLRPPPAASAESLTERRHSLEPLFAAPPFTYVDQHGATVTSSSLKGAPYIADFFFTTCRTICPLLTSKMVQLQRLLPGAGIRFVSFSVDPENDTPPVLSAYASQWNSEERRWILLSTDDRTLPVTAAGFHITAMKTGSPTDLDPIVHSGVFVLVDADGVVRGVYDSELRSDFQALVRDARTLARLPAPPPAPDRDGATLYHQLSCSNCHERPALAPPLGGILDSTRQLAEATQVVADRAYLRESILAPDAKRLAGFSLRMPAYDGLLSERELETLVDFMIAMPKPTTLPSTEVPVMEDPVCHMKVRATDDAVVATVDGGTYYFCSDYCRDQFMERPGAFIGK